MTVADICRRADFNRVVHNVQGNLAVNCLLGLRRGSEFAHAQELLSAYSEGGLQAVDGNDLSGDIIAHALATAGLPVSRAYVGSYTALVNLYAKQANAALVSKGCADVAIGVKRLAKELPLWLRVTVVVPPLVRQHLHNRTLEHQGMRHRARSTSVVPFRFVPKGR